MKSKDSTAAPARAIPLEAIDELGSAKSMAMLVLMAATIIEETDQMNALVWLGDAIMEKIEQVQEMLTEACAEAKVAS